MGTAKRERQKAGRQSRRAEAEAAAKKARRNRNLRNYSIYGLVLVVIVVGLLIWNRGGDKKSSVSTTATTPSPRSP